MKLISSAAISRQYDIFVSPKVTTELLPSRFACHLPQWWRQGETLPALWRRGGTAEGQKRIRFLSVPAKRALHGSRKASASCLRRKRFMRPRRASFFSLHHWGRGTAPAVEGVRRIHPANCKGNRCIPVRRIISRRRPSNSNETDFFGCFYKRHSISASPKVTAELLPSAFGSQPSAFHLSRTATDGTFPEDGGFPLPNRGRIKAPSPRELARRSRD